MARKPAAKPGIRKKGSSGSTARKSTKKSSPGKEMNQGPLALLLLLVLVVTLGFSAQFFLNSPSPWTRSDTEKSTASGKDAPKIHKEPAMEKPPVPERRGEGDASSPLVPQAVPRYEIFPVQETERKRTVPPADRIPEKPRVAIIIDDIGYDMTMADALMALDIPLTLSILPHSPHGVRIARKAHARGYEVMLHLPMEPEEYPRIHPGPGGLLLAMQADELISTLQKNLAAIPHIRGVNNHMGSALTSSESHMNQIFSILKKKPLFFIDSRTAAGSRGRAAARMFQVPFGERDIFLDHVQSAENVRKSLETLLFIAQKHGSAIGIGHPHRVTLEGLRALLPKARKSHTFVYASELVDLIQ